MSSLCVLCYSVYSAVIAIIHSLFQPSHTRKKKKKIVIFSYYHSHSEAMSATLTNVLQSVYTSHPFVDTEQNSVIEDLNIIYSQTTFKHCQFVSFLNFLLLLLQTARCLLRRWSQQEQCLWSFPWSGTDMLLFPTSLRITQPMRTSDFSLECL